MKERKQNDPVNNASKEQMSIEYLNNKVFESLIRNFKKAKRCKRKRKAEFDIAQAELAKAFYTLAENIIRAFKFQLVDTDEMLQEGVLICFERLNHFDPKKGKAFNYYTTCTLNHFRQLYRSEKTFKLFKERYFDYKKKTDRFSGPTKKKIERDDLDD